MKIVPFHTVQPRQIEAAFSTFHRLRKEHAAGYLSHEGIADFHRDRMIHLAQHPDPAHPVHACLQDNEITAIFGTTPSPRHQALYEVPYYKITPLYVFTRSYPRLQAITAQLLGCCNADTGGVYTLRVDTHDNALAYEFSRQGFALVGTSLRLHLGNTQLQQHPLFSIYPNDSLTIRRYDRADLAAVQHIAKTGHRHSHFFQDPRFNKEKTKILFAEWIKTCADQAASRIWIAEDEGQVIGFSSCLINHALQPYIRQRIGIIDFIVVDERVQGKGTGKYLLRQSLQWFLSKVDDVELRTMADNLHAVRFYEKHGFRVLSSDHHFHLWRSGRFVV